MNKKILIGSIIAVVILVLVSFTGVVGYQTTKSSTNAKASPLFNIRTSRAIDKDSKIIDCDYVGKNKGISIMFPASDSRNTQLQKVIDIVSRINDKTFNILVKLVMKQLHKDEKYVDVNAREILQFIKENPHKTKNLITNGAYEDTLQSPCTIGGNWVSSCWLLLLIEFISGIIFLIFLPLFLLFYGLIPSTYVTCPTYVCKACMTLQL